MLEGKQAFFHMDVCTARTVKCWEAVGMVKKMNESKDGGGLKNTGVG